MTLSCSQFWQGKAFKCENMDIMKESNEGNGKSYCDQYEKKLTYRQRLYVFISDLKLELMKVFEDIKHIFLFVAISLLKHGKKLGLFTEQMNINHRPNSSYRLRVNVLHIL